MKPSELKVGKQTQYSAKSVQQLPNEIEGTFVQLKVIEDTVYIEANQHLFKISLIPEDAEQLINDTQYFVESMLVRIDSVVGIDVNFTMIIFANALHITEDMALKFVIPTTLSEQLNQFNIPTDNVDEFLKEQFVVEQYVFPFASKSMDKITLIGKRYLLTFVQNDQKILEAAQLRRLSENQTNENVAIFSGAIQFRKDYNDVQIKYALEKKYEEKVQDNEELLQLWNIYSELEYKMLQEESEAVGSIRYVDLEEFIDENNQLCVKFIVDEQPTGTFLNNTLGYAVSVNPYVPEKLSSSTEKKRHFERTTFVSSSIKTHKKINDNEFFITMRKENKMAILPFKGYLSGSITGSKIMQERRQQALETILQCKGALPNLKYIIQLGEGAKENLLPKKVIVDSLMKKVFGDSSRKFTLKQQEAIGVAINTNDIAIIQGPPGTGKTTVIRAIVERINAIHDGRVNILISSAQHDAVDNAIEKMEYGGLPAYRIGGKMGDDELKRSKNIINWIDNVQNTTEELLEKLDGQLFYKTVREIYVVLQDIHLYEDDEKYVETKLSELLCLVKILPDVREDISANIIAMINALQKKENAPSQNALVELLQGQRLSVESFLDDGQLQLMQLMHYYRIELPEEEIPEIWMELRIADDSEVGHLMPSFKEDIEQRLNEQFAEESTSGNNFAELLAQMKERLQQYFDARPHTIIDVLMDFQDDLESPSNIQQLVEKYTKINAATCQQAVSKQASLKHSELKYDYVIIDEAARANPLDLLIPMSIGKKIILVGDHKQLPHILEPEVVQKLMEQSNDPKVKDLLEKSLFERLFDLLEKTKRTKNIRTAMLKEQYRMHPVIGDFVSELFYDGKLKNGVTEAQRQNNVTRYNTKPVVWLDVPNEKGREFGTRKESKYRPAEIDRLQQELYAVLQETKGETIGIITFYKRQLIEIEKMVEQFPESDRERIDVGTVDSFQGKEFDIVYLSTVRSNKELEVGFVSNANRLNVAFSRAKRVLAVIGDSKTISQAVPSFKRFEAICKEVGFYEK